MVFIKVKVHFRIKVVWLFLCSTQYRPLEKVVKVFPRHSPVRKIPDLLLLSLSDKNHEITKNNFVSTVYSYIFIVRITVVHGCLLKLKVLSLGV